MNDRPLLIETDTDFDRLCGAEFRKLSRIHWTPLHVARLASELLVQNPGDTILDVGSGAGKFCIVGAQHTQGRFTGIEKRKELTTLSKTIAREQKIERVRFLCADALTQDWSPFSGIYLYNPFSEDPTTHSSSATLAKLRGLSSGTRVVTYYGFGAPLEPEYRIEFEEDFKPGLLQLWIKV